MSRAQITELIGQNIGWQVFRKMMMSGLDSADSGDIAIRVRQLFNANPKVKTLLVFRYRDQKAGRTRLAVEPEMPSVGADLLYRLDVPALAAQARAEMPQTPPPSRAPFGAGAMVRKQETT